MRTSLAALALAAIAAVGCSLISAAAWPSSTAGRVALVLGGWTVLGLLLAYLFLPQFEWPWAIEHSITGARKLALTIDDGPHPESTPALLDVLAAEGVSATFFLVGSGVERWPELVQRIVAEGHSIGNHTMHHRLLPLRTRSQIEEEIGRCQEILTRFGSVRLFRPPHGYKFLGLQRILRGYGLRLVAWHGSIRDTDAPGVQTIVDRALRVARSGAILLLHDNPSCRGQTVAALPTIIAGCRARGLQFVGIT